MATTTNYGWTTPDDTALVKDGASAIRTLGTSVDTTTKNLNPSTTLGDIEYRSSTSNTNTRLGIGSTSQVLTVSGGVPTWATPAAGGGMTLISTTALTGATTTLSSIPQTYKSLVLYITGHYPSTNNALFRMRVNASSASVYDGAGDQNNGALEYTDQNHVKLGVYGQASSGTNYLTNHVAMTIPNYTTSSVFKVLDFLQIWRTGEATPRPIFESISWSFRDTTAITSLEFSYSTGNIGGGSVQLYGVN
jgi:hypothetical protein